MNFLNTGLRTLSATPGTLNRCRSRGAGGQEQFRNRGNESHSSLLVCVLSLLHFFAPLVLMTVPSDGFYYDSHSHQWREWSSEKLVVCPESHSFCRSRSHALLWVLIQRPKLVNSRRVLKYSPYPRTHRKPPSPASSVEASHLAVNTGVRRVLKPVGYS